LPFDKGAGSGCIGSKKSRLRAGQRELVTIFSKEKVGGTVKSLQISWNVVKRLQLD